MFKGILIGDAYGAGFEFKNSMLVHNDAKKFYDHPTHMASDGSGNSLRAGQYTDDTQMSIAVAKALLSGDLSRESFAKSFVDTFQGDPRKGYAKRFYEFLITNRTVESFLSNIRPDSEKNGAAMRSVPLGVLSSPDEVMRVADIQASITHNTQIGRDSSKIVGLAAYYLLRKDSKEGLISFIEHKVPGYDLKTPWTGKVPCHGIATAKAALTVLMSTDSMKETLIRSVAFGGDTDSVASIAAGLLDCYKGKIDDMPKKLLETCEQGNYGLNYCESLEHQLFTKYHIKD